MGGLIILSIICAGSTRGVRKAKRAEDKWARRAAEARSSAGILSRKTSRKFGIMRVPACSYRGLGTGSVEDAGVFQHLKSRKRQWRDRESARAYEAERSEREKAEAAASRVVREREHRRAAQRFPGCACIGVFDRDE